ncbi:MAG: geranylgeranylglyceryl phosphate synthase family protein, partial [Bacteroidia bacterium]|nr:geranylgeranylglyceryl phosphate synthase family protein [Bacteroidia bacterium]
MGNVYASFLKSKKTKKPLLAILADPEHYSVKTSNYLFKLINQYADILLVGGSLTTKKQTIRLIEHAKKVCKKPIVIFPGPGTESNAQADAFLLLSLISGRNPDLLIGRQVENAFELQKSKLEIISTGYILIDGGIATSVSYISQTQPIPADKINIITATALAGQQLGLQCIYLEAGSGAKNPVSKEIIIALKKIIDIPIIVGGGI